MLDLKALDWFTVIGRGPVAVVASPANYRRDDHPLLGEKVLIDGTPYTVLGVESHLMPEIRQGDKIGLLVQPEAVLTLD